MKNETVYLRSELESGICERCYEDSDEIYNDGTMRWCVDCIEEQRFYELTMKGV